MYDNLRMEEDKKNILNFAGKSRKSGSKKSGVNGHKYPYIKTKKDLNGNSFNKVSLLEYARDCRYVVRIMREENGEVCLYGYLVPYDELTLFLNETEKKDFDGQVIEVEKYIPKDLA